MARHGGSGDGGQAGIESITRPTGPIAAVLGVLGTIGVVWIVIKHPAIAGRAIGYAAILSIFLGGDAPNVHPIIGLLGICAGAYACDRRPRRRRSRS